MFYILKTLYSTKVCVMTATITEVASNTATANILLPILSEMVFILQYMLVHFAIL